MAEGGTANGNAFGTAGTRRVLTVGVPPPGVAWLGVGRFFFAVKMFAEVAGVAPNGVSTPGKVGDKEAPPGVGGTARAGSWGAAFLTTRSAAF